MDYVTLAHGAGGTVMQSLIKKYFLDFLGGSKAEVPLEALDDAAVVDDVVLKSDSHTVKPLFFPGGDIGRLAVAGTVNDIAVMGAEPKALAAGFIIEEGFPIANLDKVLRGMRDACREAGVYVVTGDTKVVEKDALDQLVINTSGIGKRSEALDENLAVVKKYRPIDSRWLLDSNLRKGDKIIVSGTVGDHGLALLAFREGYNFGGNIVSDVAPLNKLVQKLLKVGGIVSMKDPTRGGLANTLNEWSEKSMVGITVKESRIPISEGVKAACEMLGIDPLEVGNEGKLVIAVVPQKAEEVLAALRDTKEGREAQIVGEATDKFGEVVLETSVGGRRLLPPPAGDPIPRIC
ncbi:hydrogenase expression/formation protein HypE [Candidatus Hecatella orcuttiae]|jgi:hydrogenase expression/formation protein HypE|uniref:hydrogenase expression/formation protein HypE n=1 Tax=Candidatus Hecatella orcuttiae TaxID=1935119 RepID=UPI002867E92D|nr:hydrogenase expression/formation protein HypE [Candidatus Hecatella orcuttiae]